MRRTISSHKSSERREEFFKGCCNSVTSHMRKISSHPLNLREIVHIFNHLANVTLVLVLWFSKLKMVLMFRSCTKFMCATPHPKKEETEAVLILSSLLYLSKSMSKRNTGTCILTGQSRWQVIFVMQLVFAAMAMPSFSYLIDRSEPQFYS